MKKQGKRMLALLMGMLMFCSCSVVAFAVPEPELKQTNKARYGTENALGQIVQNLTEEKDDDKSYAISSLETDGSTVTATISNTDACTLVVAAYAEDTAQMVSVGVVQIEADCGKAAVTLDIDAMPKYYVLKAFLLDDEHHALCKSYESREQTRSFEAFLAKHPEDFSDDTVLVFDGEKETEDFAVLTDDVQTGTYSESMTYVYDEATDSYTFTNATHQVKSLQDGDLFYYDGAGEDYLLLKVKYKMVIGSTVVIVQDPDVGVDELFSFIRIDEAEGDYDRMEPLRQEELGEALLLDDSVRAQAEIDDSSSHSWSNSLKIKYPQADLPEGEKPPMWQFKAEGSLKLSIETSMSLYYDVVLFGEDYYELKHELSLTLELSGKATAGFDLTPYLKIPIPEIPIGTTGFTLKFEPTFVFKGNIAVSIALIKLNYTKTTTADSENELRATDDKDVDFDGLDLDDKVELSVGFELSSELSYLKCLSLKCTTGIGVQAVGDKAPVGLLWEALHQDELHDCTFCLDADLNRYLEGGVIFKFQFLGLKFENEIVSVRNEDKLFDFYISSTLGFGKGVCSNRYHALTIEVKENDQAFKDAAVSCETGKCDADGDGKFNETSIMTGDDGTAKLYCKPGTHTITVSADGYTPKTVTVKILEVEKTVTVTFGSAPGQDDPDGPGDLSAYNVGETFTFGNYPQSRVTDSATLAALNAAPKTWHSYRYYSGTGNGADGQMTEKDYMQYADVQLDTRYRAVKFSQYRPWNTGSTSSAKTSYQDDNGYVVNTVYWFRYEPLQWRVLDPAAGLVLCETIIDSQPFNHYALDRLEDDHECWGDADRMHYASNYAESSLRQWLNDDFFNTAFTTVQKAKIAETTLDNSAHYSIYSSTSTTDKVFLLSYAEAFNSAVFSDRNERRTNGSDYAKCQGLWAAYTDTNGNVYYPWLLRTAEGSRSIRTVFSDGRVDTINTDFSYYGVRPALRLNLGYGISKSSRKTATQAEETCTVQKGMRYTISQSGAVTGREYVLAVRQAGATDVAAETLYFIDQQTAASNELSFDYVPRMSGECTVEVFGDFSQSEKHTIRWVVDGAATEQQLAEGATIVKPADPVKDGYVFKGWSPAVPATMPAKDMTFTAQFKKIVATSLKIKKMPAKTEYIYRNDNTLNLADMELEVTYSDGTTKSVDPSRCTVSGYSAKPRGDKTITVEFEGQKAQFTVTVNYTWWQWLIIIFLFGWIWY